MNYELAKQLKDAGFPNLHPEVPCENCRDADDDCSLTPELSELIDACGDHIQLGVNWDLEGAVARTCDTVCYGKTLEEATAKLWLELNKKQ